MITLKTVSFYIHSSDFELPKFPRRLRKSIMREIGKSDMLNIPMRKRQKLLEFSLNNVVIYFVSFIRAF